MPQENCKPTIKNTEDNWNGKVLYLDRNQNESILKKHTVDEENLFTMEQARITRIRIYGLKYGKSYTFKTNVPEEYAERYAEIYRSQGLDVQIADPALSDIGLKMENWNAILTRKKKKQ